jgi:putative transposase
MALSQSVASELLEAFRAGEGVDLIRESVRLVMQELIETEAVEHIGAGRYERTESRVTDRNGSRPRLIATQAGDIELRIPKLRNGSFFPAILEPRRRIDQALYAVVMEAYVNGVSTRAVDDLVTALGVESGISKSEVSRICAGLDEQVEAFRSRPLHHTTFPYVFLDATYLHVRRTGQVTSMAVVVATGVTADGGREVLGVDVGDSEDEVFWRGFLRTWKQRGLTGVRLVISDQHSGLVAALGRVSSKVWGINAAGCTSSATCSRSCPCRTRTWLPRCSEPSSPNPTPKPWPPPGTASATSWPPRFPRSGR